MMKYLQKLGKSLMLPVAVLPVAAILSGIGWWIAGATGDPTNLAAVFLQSAGGYVRPPITDQTFVPEVF